VSMKVENALQIWTYFPLYLSIVRLQIITPELVARSSQLVAFLAAHSSQLSLTFAPLQFEL
jgi:hypothetical protein